MFNQRLVYQLRRWHFLQLRRTLHQNILVSKKKSHLLLFLLCWQSIIYLILKVLLTTHQPCMSLVMRLFVDCDWWDLIGQCYWCRYFITCSQGDGTCWCGGWKVSPWQSGCDIYKCWLPTASAFLWPLSSYQQWQFASIQWTWY